MADDEEEIDEEETSNTIGVGIFEFLFFSN
jgi:hypothetical protein